MRSLTEGRPAGGLAARRLFAADLESVIEAGLAAWPEGCVWPVSEAEFDRLLGESWAAYAELLAGQPAAVQDVLLADTPLVGLMIQHLHARLVEGRCRYGDRLLYGRSARPFFRPDWEQLAGAHRGAAQPGGHWRGQARAVAKRFAYNRHVVWPLRGFAGSAAWAIGGRNPLRDDYQAEQRLSCRYPPAEALLAGAGAAGGGDLAALDGPLRALVERLDEVARGLGALPLEGERIVRCWLSRLADLDAAYHRLRARRDLPRLLLLTNGGLALNRIIALAARSRGTRVIGFSHGNEVGTVSLRNAAFIEFAPCDTYVCLSPASARQYRAGYRQSPLSRLREVTFSSVTTRRYLGLAREAEQQPPPERVRTVMMIGHPLTPIRYQGGGGVYLPFQLDVQLRLTRAVQAHGRTVIFKAHPEAPPAADRLFEELGAEVVREPFETSWQRADAFLFSYAQTTAFGFAVCTNRPLILLDVAGLAWNAEPYALLRRRCRMVPAAFDTDNRLRFDESRLSAVLDAPPDRPDPGYVEAMMAAG